MQKKTLEELNLLDDFMFGNVMSYPVIGNEVCKRILSVIMGREVPKVQIVPQKIYYGTDTSRHGIRLDVYAEEDSEGIHTIYDIEPDNKTSLKSVLPRRARFYHAKIDSDCLDSGTDYSLLKRVIVIFISPYDPFHLGRMVYTIKNCCVEEPDMLYDDGAETIFLYTRGKNGNPPEELQKLLHYLENSRKENAENAILKDIHNMVETVRRDKEVSLEYMKIFEREKMIRDEGKAEGFTEGIINGNAKFIHIIRKKHEKQLSSADIADFLEYDEAYIQQIIRLLHENPNADDIEIAKSLLQTTRSIPQNQELYFKP